jgi:holin-like protein
MIRQCFIIFGCLALGELIVWLTDIPIPSSIIGMLLLAALLQAKVIREEWIKGMSDFLISNMGFFFVPPGVALMLYLDVIKAEFVPIAVATVVSTILVLVATGWTHQLFKLNGNTSE